MIKIPNLMKTKLFSFIALIVIAFTSCKNKELDEEQVTTASTQQRTSLISEYRNVTGFNKIDVEGVFDIYLTQGGEEWVKIDAAEDVMKNIITLVEDGVLKIKFEGSARLKKLNSIKININISDINEIKTACVGKLTCSDLLNLKRLFLINKSVGTTELKLNADILTVQSETLGLLELKGKVNDVNIKHAGFGAIQAFDLIAENLILNSEGIGAAEVYASNNLTINVKGLGGVKYKGHPKHKTIHKEGLGKVESAD